MGPGVGRGIFNAPGADWMELCNWGGDGTPTAVYHYSITDVTDTFSCGNFDNLAGLLHPVQNWHVGNNEFELWHHPYYVGEPNSYGGLVRLSYSNPGTRPKPAGYPEGALGPADVSQLCGIAPSPMVLPEVFPEPMTAPGIFPQAYPPLRAPAFAPFRLPVRYWKPFDRLNPWVDTGGDPYGPPDSFKPPVPVSRPVSPPPVDPPNTPPSRRRERKEPVGGRIANGLLAAGKSLLDGVSETGDFINAMYSALPAGVKRKARAKTIQAKGLAVLQNWRQYGNKPVAANAFWNIVQNEIGDRTYGYIGSRIRKATKANPYWVSPVGPQAGGRFRPGVPLRYER